MSFEVTIGCLDCREFVDFHRFESEGCAGEPGGGPPVADLYVAGSLFWAPFQKWEGAVALWFLRKHSGHRVALDADGPDPNPLPGDPEAEGWTKALDPMQLWEYAGYDRAWWPEGTKRCSGVGPNRVRCRLPDRHVDPWTGTPTACDYRPSRHP